TSYRIDLGAKDSRLQGWAQIDNPTGESWENVEVSLLSGSPVSFVMNLYQPLFTSRASVAVPGGQVAAPRQYESAVSQAGIVLDEKQIAALPMVGNDPLALIATLPGYRANPMGHELDALGGLPSSMAKAVRDGLSVGDNFRADQGFQPAQATEVRDFFEYRFPFPVQLASRQSALLPFLQKTAPTERLSIYNASADRGNPRLGVRLENNTDVPLEPGPITFFEEGRYAGEAVLAYLPRSEKRLVSYGVDYDIQVAAKPKSSPETTVRITAAKGVVTLFKESLLTTTYEIRNKGTQPKTLIVEHARTGARRLNDETEPWETTDNYYRFRVKLAPGETTELTPREIVSRSTQIRVGGLTREQFAATFSNSETPQALRESIGAIIDLQERVATLTRERTEVEAKIARLFPDQNRMRNNLNALRSTAEEQALRSRYLGELTRQEDEIAALRARSDALEQEVVAAQADLADRIEQLAWDEPSKN
ncbi:MAG TPA: hypothetical protein VFY29_20050, partial [Terriglobia bacterium]|nr:hypothetical protein [Terriglobia bacterium]